MTEDEARAIVGSLLEELSATKAEMEQATRRARGLEQIIGGFVIMVPELAGLVPEFPKSRPPRRGRRPRVTPDATAPTVPTRQPQPAPDSLTPDQPAVPDQ